MSEKRDRDLERIWKRIGLALFIAAIILVAGPQVIDLFVPDFR
jgi:hypothetical protein